MKQIGWLTRALSVLLCTVMLLTACSFTLFAADTDAEARRLFSSLQQAFLSLRRGRPGRLPPPVDDLDSGLNPHERAMLANSLHCSIIGAPATVARGLQEFIVSTGADELMVTGQIFDHEARKRSFRIVAEVALNGPHIFG